MKKKRSALKLFVLGIVFLFFTISISAHAAFNTNYAITGDPAEDIVQVALAQKDKTGAQLGYNGQWCDAFVKDCAIYAKVSAAIPKAGGVTALRQAVIDAGGQPVDLQETPQRGDLVFYIRRGDAKYYHVGIMIDNTKSVQGNVNDKVCIVDKPSYFHVSKAGDCDYSFIRPNYNNENMANKLYAYGTSGNIDWYYAGKANNLTLCLVGNGAMPDQYANMGPFSFYYLKDGNYEKYNYNSSYTYFAAAYKKAGELLGYQNIKKIEIGDGITSVSSGAFSTVFSSVTTVSFGRNIKKIGSNAFYGASSLKNIIFGADSVESIDSGAFSTIKV